MVECKVYRARLLQWREADSKLWQPRSWRFMLLRTLKALPHPECGHLKGFSPVCEWLWIRSELGREKALLHVWQM